MPRAASLDFSDDDAELYQIVPHKRKIASPERPIGLLIRLKAHHRHLLAIGVHGELCAAVLLAQACLRNGDTSVNSPANVRCAGTNQPQHRVAPTLLYRICQGKIEEHGGERGGSTVKVLVRAGDMISEKVLIRWK